MKSFIILAVWLPLATFGGPVILNQRIVNDYIALDSNNPDYSSITRISKTFFIVHGWHQSDETAILVEMSAAYQNMDPSANIFLVNYTQLASESYIYARNIVNLAGEDLGSQIVAMLDADAILIQNVHMIGHSLGTHVCGKAAAVIQNAVGVKVPRISATDPAGPLFRTLWVDGFLDPLQKDVTDMLDITHTTYTAGTLEPFGHVDTYVHNCITGMQPACCWNLSEDDLLYCSHRMAPTYFVESILSCGFKQTSLDATDITYGQHMDLNIRGIFTMSVGSVAPYALGDISCD